MKIFVDMDGILTNYREAIVDYYGADHYKDLTPVDIRRIGDNEHFWSGLKKTSIADDLTRGLNLIYGGYTILTANNNSVHCISGKRDWVSKNLIHMPIAIIITDAKERYAGGNILIDNSDTDNWKANNGFLIKYKPSNNKLTVSDVLHKISKYKRKMKGV